MPMPAMNEAATTLRSAFVSAMAASTASALRGERAPLDQAAAEDRGQQAEQR